MTVSGCINFGTANVFNTVFFPISVRFHLLQDFNHWLNILHICKILMLLEIKVKHLVFRDLKNVVVTMATGICFSTEYLLY